MPNKKSVAVVLVLVMVLSLAVAFPAVASPRGNAAAPAVATRLLKEWNIRGNLGPYISAVAKAMGPGATFAGLSRSDAGYRDEVAHFLAGLLADAGVLTAAGAGRPAVPAGAKRVIVVFRDTTGNEAVQDTVLAGAGASKVLSLPLVNAAAAIVTPAAENALKRRPEVLRIDPDPVVTASSQVIPWGITQVNADKAWGTSTGSGVRVAVLDTGIQLNHPDLSVAGGANFTSQQRSRYGDDNGHGTHVAGTIAALDNQVGVVGAAPQSLLYSVKVLDRHGSGFVSNIIAGLDWCIQNNIRVANMSLGTSTHVQSFEDAVNRAYNSGVLLVAAAGNSGPADNTVGYPARYDNVIAVSATDASNTIASFSSRGPQVALAAPGVNILSTYTDSTYRTLSGTSMAAPHVAGTAALVLAANPGWNNTQVYNRLTQTATHLGAADLYGFGLVNAQAAVGTTTAPQPGSIAGTVSRAGGGAISNATVIVDGAGLSATTDTNGHYQINNVPAGTYSVTASAAGYVPLTSTDVVVQNNQTTSLSFVLNPVTTSPLTVNVTTSGTYRYNSSVNITVNVTDSANAAVAGAAVTVTVHNSEGNQVYNASGTTDTSGTASFRYRIPNRAPTGQYTVTAEAGRNGSAGTGSAVFTVTR